MRNKARCNYLKKIFACCALAFLLFSISAPCFADGGVLVDGGAYYWGNISDTPTLDEVGKYVRSYDTVEQRNQDTQSIYDTYYNSTAVAYLLDVVKKQYEIGLFGGSVPVAITTRVAQNSAPSPSDPNATYGYTWELLVYCVRQSDIASLSLNDSKRYADIGIEYSTALGYFAEKNGFRLDYYSIYSNGDVEFEGYVSDGRLNYINRDYSGPYSRFVAIFNDGYWYSGANGYYASYWANGASVPVVYTDVMTLYNDTEKVPQYVTNVNNFDYDLDIPSIITAVPNGAKQIINNAFGFEIFGINVAGLLSVLLIVAIVGFVVKWLMSR